jgi:hypothetical protein
MVHRQLQVRLLETVYSAIGVSDRDEELMR